MHWPAPMTKDGKPRHDVSALYVVDISLGFSDSLIRWIGLTLGRKWRGSTRLTPKKSRQLVSPTSQSSTSSVFCPRQPSFLLSTRLSFTRTSISHRIGKRDTHFLLRSCPQHDVVEYSLSKGIAITAYSPLGSNDSPLLENEIVNKLAKKYDASPANILISLHLNRPQISGMLQFFRCFSNSNL